LYTIKDILRIEVAAALGFYGGDLELKLEVLEPIDCDSMEIALSHIITGYIKSHTGRLSAVCGCSVAAGAGAAAGTAYLMGGDLRRIASAIKNLIGNLAGVICDGVNQYSGNDRDRQNYTPNNGRKTIW
jgi:L-cysteine desulfidase